MGTEETLFPGVNWPGSEKLTFDLYLTPRLRIRGAIPPPQLVFMAWCLMKNEQEHKAEETDETE
jgi:hypothetical protein